MRKLFGEVVAILNGPAPYAAVIRSDTKELMRAYVNTQREGERVVAALLPNLENFEPDPDAPDSASR